MGFWRLIHHAIDHEGAKKLDQKYGKPGPYAGETLWQSFTRNRRASRWSDQYWRDNEVINRASTPLSHLGMDLGHPPNCECRWCWS